MTLLPEPRQVQWYVVFADSERRTWRSLFTRKGFRHCYAFGRWGATWVRIDPVAHWAQVDVVEQGTLVANGFEDLIDLTKKKSPGCSIVCVQRWMVPKGLPSILPLGCVGVVKYLLGIHSRSVTPWGLYVELIEKFNGHPV